jgi:hypothetical protein
MARAPSPGVPRQQFSRAGRELRDNFGFTRNHDFPRKDSHGIQHARTHAGSGHRHRRPEPAGQGQRHERADVVRNRAGHGVAGRNTGGACRRAGRARQVFHFGHRSRHADGARRPDRRRLRRSFPRKTSPRDTRLAGHLDRHRALSQAGTGSRAWRLHRRRHRPDHRLRHALLLGRCLVRGQGNRCRHDRRRRHPAAPAPPRR